jgi:hypothetical protein
MRGRPREMRLSWAVMDNHLQGSHHMVDCSVCHHGSHGQGFRMRSATTVHSKTPTQSRKQIDWTVVAGTTIMDQAAQAPLFCPTQTMEAQMEICRVASKCNATFPETIKIPRVLCHVSHCHVSRGRQRRQPHHIRHRL